MYTTPLSSLIFSRSLNHTTLNSYLLHNNNLYYCVTRLQDTISDISSWMTSNLLSWNSSETEFMLICILQQISQITNRSFSLPSNLPITYTYSAVTLVSSLTQILPYLKGCRPYLVLEITTSMTIAVSDTPSTFKTASTIRYFSSSLQTWLL